MGKYFRLANMIVAGIIIAATIWNNKNYTQHEFFANITLAVLFIIAAKVDYIYDKTGGDGR